MHKKKESIIIKSPAASAMFDTLKEYTDAANGYPNFHSAHEGFAILKEEVDELWEHVKVKQGKRNVKAMRKEAVQVAAMAIRFILDVCVDNKKGQK